MESTQAVKDPALVEDHSITKRKAGRPRKSPPMEVAAEVSTFESDFEARDVSEVVDSGDGSHGTSEERSKVSWEPSFRVLYERQIGPCVGPGFDQWVLVYMPLLSKRTRHHFILLNPNLKAWECVFTSGTSESSLNFVFHFLNRFGLCLDPAIIAGKALNVIVFMYYLIFSQEYVVFFEQEQVFRAYNGIYWEALTSRELIARAMRFVSTFGIAQCEQALCTHTDSLLNAVKPHITIKRWPSLVGKGYRNGFLHLHNGLYALAKHHPFQWLRNYINIDVPDDIVPLPTEIGLRFLLDTCAESIKTLNVVYVWLWNNENPPWGQVLYNINGNPCGSKSKLMELLLEMFKVRARAGDANAITPFNLKDLLLDKEQIIFPDSNPDTWSKRFVELLKKLCAGDGALLEEKYGATWWYKAHFCITIINNEVFDNVKGYQQDAMQDRVVNLVLPQIIQPALVSDLMRYIEKDYPYLVLSASPPLELLQTMVRARALNAAMGSGAEAPMIQFLNSRLEHSPGSTTDGKALKTEYDNFIKTTAKDDKSFLKTHTYKTFSQFYQRLSFDLGRMDKTDIEKDRKSKVTKFNNVKLGTPSEETQLNFSPQGVEKQLNENSLLFNSIKFIEPKGGIIEGPRLDPHKNLKLYQLLKNVKDKSVKELITGKKIALPGEKRHFESIAYGFGKTVTSLEAKDFYESSEIDYQDTLVKRGHVDYGTILDCEELIKGPLTELLLGRNQDFYFHPTRGSDLRFLKPGNRYIIDNRVFDTREDFPEERKKQLPKPELVKQVEESQPSVQLKRYDPKGPDLFAGLEAETIAEFKDATATNHMDSIDLPSVPSFESSNAPIRRPSDDYDFSTSEETSNDVDFSTFQETSNGTGSMEAPPEVSTLFNPVIDDAIDSGNIENLSEEDIQRLTGD